MKTIFNFLAILSFGLIISAISSKQTSELTGSKVGDVKYSILNPSDFAKVHGEEAKNWVLLTGQKKNELDTKELSKYWQKDLPDARGMFIRTMNDLQGNGADPQSARLVGSEQQDAFQGHHHLYSYTTSNAGGNATYIGAPRGTSDDKIVPSANIHSDNTVVRNATTDNTNGIPRVAQETRPKNIALYLYIKVN